MPVGREGLVDLNRTLCDELSTRGLLATCFPGSLNRETQRKNSMQRLKLLVAKLKDNQSKQCKYLIDSGSQLSNFF